ncbi:MAG: hypothetical protein IK117_06695 [Bacteroidales bacterium]|nr:hypothetical protein [Bacteroidales bacterium]
MKHILKMKDLYGSEIRTRAVMEQFATTLQNGDEYLLDMQGVELISRSAADELYNILHGTKNVEIINQSEFVAKMMDAVTLGRFQPRNRSVGKTPIIVCNDLNAIIKHLY